jgi:tetratricopeptide (TPR) repeat protein
MTQRFIVPSIIVITLAMVAFANWRDARDRAHPAAGVRPARAPVETTTRADLERTVETMDARLETLPADGNAAVQLASALVRLQRVNNDAAAVIQAERRLRAFLARVPGHYEAQRMLGTVLLSQHRFRDAIREAEKARAMDGRDAWNYGVLGDAHLEVGSYDDAFAAFDRMNQLRPGPTSYARVAYALELKGDLEGALAAMKMAADGTSAHDAEGQAWHYAQLGNLLLQLGRVGGAKREFERAAFTFPDHPYAMSGLARVKIAEGDLRGALALYSRLLSKTPTPELAAIAGDLHVRLGERERAEELYGMAESLERSGWASEEPQPQALARFLAERDRDIAEAVRLAEQAARSRRDIFTMDALAWAYFKAGRLDDAREAADAAMRTGTHDGRIVYHAAAIRAAQGDIDAARAMLERVHRTARALDPIAAAGAEALLRILIALATA